MARLPRLCVPGQPHLLFQLGRGRQPVFMDDDDRRFFLDLLQQAAATHLVAIHAYALLNHEVRLLVTPAAANSLSRLMQTIGRRYGSRFNRRHGHTGSLWEGRFRATVIEPGERVLDCMRYVEQASLTPFADSARMEGSAWSSAAHHIGESTDPRVTDHREYWSLGNTPFDREAAYKRLSQHALTQDEMLQISDAVMKGWPLGSLEFLKELAAHTNRRLAPLRRGRPRKSPET